MKLVAQAVEVGYPEASTEYYHKTYKLRKARYGYYELSSVNWTV